MYNFIDLDFILINISHRRVYQSLRFLLSVRRNSLVTNVALGRIAIHGGKYVYIVLWSVYVNNSFVCIVMFSCLQLLGWIMMK